MIAIHNINSPFSERWMKYCRKKSIEYTNVDIYDSNIINYLKKNDIKFLFCQTAIDDYKTSLIAKSIILSIEKAGIKTYPNYESLWHYDDKISQKKLFEAVGIPHAPMYVFYDLDKTNDWLSTANFPYVFKLKGGASSSNVLLLKNKREANRFAKKMFNKGIKPIRPVLNDFSTKSRIHSQNKDWLATLKRLPTTIRNIRKANQQMPRQCGYFLIQKFLAGNDFDTRVVIVGNKAFAFRRFTRPNDFRASGSKCIDLTQKNIDKRAIKISFESAKKIGSISMAFDVIFNLENEPVIIEMSYTCPVETISKLGGYWDPTLVFHSEQVSLEEAIIEHVLDIIN